MKHSSENNEFSEINKNYNLKSDAVEELLDAESGEVPEYSQEELARYRGRKGLQIPGTVKVLFIKAWFAGAVCFFFLWGLGNYVGNLIDMLFIVGVALGIVTDLLTNNVIRFIEETEGDNDRWMMYHKKGAVSLFVNILYAFVIILSVYMLYNLINYAIISITGAVDTLPLGVEPILFGVFCMAVDLLFLGVKHLLSSILSDAKKAAGK